MSRGECWGYQAPGLRHAFLPAIVSAPGRIHGELLRLDVQQPSLEGTGRLSVGCT